jgi:hypothetical protein
MVKAYSPPGIAAIVGNGVNLGETRLFVIPVPEGSDRDMLFQEGSGFCPAGSGGRMPRPLFFEHPFDR